MANGRLDLIEIPNAHFIFRTNFRGEAGPYNEEGERFFSVILEGDALKQAEEYGMLIKHTKGGNGYDPVAYIKVNVGYKIKDPVAWLINSRCKRVLTQDSIGILDHMQFTNVDMVVRPHPWHNGPASGVNAYLEEIYCTVKESSFAQKYYDIPEDGAPRTDE